MSISLFADLFADLAAPVLPATPCESCDSCEDQALARPTAEFEHLRTAANFANASADSQDSQAFANRENGLQALYSCGSSQNSQDSQGPAAEAGQRRSANPLMTKAQGDACHAGAWGDAEISAFSARVLLFIRRGVDADAADNLAERLTLRDREGDARRVCFECSNYLRGRCLKPKAAGVGAELGQLAHTLQRCVAFNTATG